VLSIVNILVFGKTAASIVFMGFVASSKVKFSQYLHIARFLLHGPVPGKKIMIYDAASHNLVPIISYH
jgi:hypothetical protein